jgi:hypothetical protein
MKKSIVPGCVFALSLLTGLCGCEKKSGEAVITGKDYVAAAKQGEEIKDERATNNEQWIVKVGCSITDVRSKSVPIERSGRSCAKTIASK